MTRFDVPSLAEVTGHLAGVAAGRKAPDLVITGARVLSVYTERLLPDRETWISRGRIAAIRPAGDSRFGESLQYDAGGGILAPGLVDAHVHIESSMMTACAYGEVALLNGTTTIFCDSHEIGNVCDHQGVVRDGKVLAAVDLPIAGLLSDARAGEVAAKTTVFKKVWNEVGCQLPYMGFNLLPLSVIPEIRLTDKGLVLCPEMKLVPLFETNLQ